MLEFNARRMRSEPLFQEVVPCRVNPLEQRFQPIELLPHRDPFLYVNRISYLDEKNGHLTAEMDVAYELDVFRGHFPKEPVFPGVLQVESMCQALACLFILLGAHEGSSSLRLTRILETTFLRPVTPGAVLVIRCAVEESNGFRSTGLAQISVLGLVTSFGRYEVSWG